MAEAHRFKIPPSKMTRAEFITVYGSVYEQSPHFAEAVFPAAAAGETETLEELALALRDAVDVSSSKVQRALIRAHPDLAARLRAASLTQASASEQAGAGLGQCTPEELAEFTALNGRYKEKYGFPFIKAVRGFSRSEILAEFRRRIDHPTDKEFRTALGEIHKIAYFRLVDLTERKDRD